MTAELSSSAIGCCMKAAIIKLYYWSNMTAEVIKLYYWLLEESCINQALLLAVLIKLCYWLIENS